MTVVLVVQIIWALAAAFLAILVLLHSPKGDGIGGQSQIFTSAKTAEKTLNQVTWALGTVFITLTIVLSAGWLNR
jgi:preprotein translocase subunit SecG